MYFTDGLKAIKVTKHSKYCGKSIDEYNIWKLANLKSSEPQQSRFSSNFYCSSRFCPPHK